jgi:hypothetical protein
MIRDVIVIGQGVRFTGAAVDSRALPQRQTFRRHPTSRLAWSAPSTIRRNLLGKPVRPIGVVTLRKFLSIDPDRRGGSSIGTQFKR